MNLFRLIPSAICRHQKISILLVVSIVVLLTIFQVQNKQSSNIHSFEDSDAYCNAPVLLHRRDNRSFTNFLLAQVQILIRHGDRAPIDLKALPNTDPVRISCVFNETYSHDNELTKMKDVAARNIFHVKGSKHHLIVNELSVCQGGQLTPYGYLQHLYLGNSFQSRYKGLLSKVNVPADIHVQATDHHRTIQSAASFLTGVFYDQLIGKSPKVVIDVHKDRIPHGHFLLDENSNDLACPVLKREIHKMHGSRSVSFFLTNVEPMMKKIANMLLVPRDSMPSYNRLVDILFAKLCHGQGVPLGPTYRLPNSLVKQILQFSHVYVKVFHSGLAQLQSLSLLSQIAQRSLDLIRNLPNAKKIILYSAHDTALAPFLQLLGIWDGKWPPYASNIYVEFYEKSDNTDFSVRGRIISTYFRILYNGIAMKNIWFCKSLVDGELCPVSDLYRYVSNNVYDNSLATMDQSTFDELLFKRIKRLCRDAADK